MLENMFENSKNLDNGSIPYKKVSNLFLTPPMSQTSDLERYYRNCHFRSDNYILIPRKPMPKD